MNTEHITESHILLNTEHFGILSTHSIELEGFPLGSVVPYCLDAKGLPVILISDIAEHTKNVKSDSRCSLTVVAKATDVQANGRLCIIGNMEELPEEEKVTQDRYYRHFPKSVVYHKAHNFKFYRLKPVSARYIGGFGVMGWVDGVDFSLENPFHGEDELRVIEHMNTDHHRDLIKYCEFYKKVSISAEDTVKMVGIDSLGFDVFINETKIRFSFKNQVKNGKEAREALVGMSKQMS